MWESRWIRQWLSTARTIAAGMPRHLTIATGRHCWSQHMYTIRRTNGGAAPLPASSGRINRHRLQRGGVRQANNALCRMKDHARTRHYLTRRTAEGLSKP
jgi:hypothetical protein